MAEPTTVASGIKLASLLLEQAEKQGLLDKLKRVFKAKPRILLLGAQGAGKSNFLNSLSVDHPSAIARENRTIFPEAHLLVIEGNNPFKFVDMPGDSNMESLREAAIREALSAKDGIAGVINIVSYGYHEYQVDRKSVFLPDGTVDPSYLEKHRAYEIEQLSEWVSLLGSSLTIDWIVTLATKADLWWDQSEQVKKHYKEGAYYKALTSNSDPLLNPTFLMYSSVFSKFYGEAPLSGYFDERDRHVLHDMFIRTLLAALVKHQL